MEVCDDGRLALVSALFLLEEWEVGEDCWTNESGTIFCQRMRQLGVLVRECESMEPLHDAIIDYRGDV